MHVWPPSKCLSPESWTYCFLNYMKKSKISEWENRIFSPEMKMAELIDLNYRLLTVLSRTGIGLGFGESSVAEACRANGMDVNTFILICTMYSLPEYVPDRKILSDADPAAIVEYLHNSHSFYIRYGFMKLDKSMKSLVGPCPEHQKKVILKFLSDYRQEVEKHFEYEETTLFPYVRAMIDGGDGGTYTISEFREHHDNIEEKLEDLKNLIMKYLPESCSGETAGMVLLDLFSLAEDLNIHTAIENNVLVPVMSMMENKRKARI